MNRSLPQQTDSPRSRRGLAVIWLLALILLASVCLVFTLFWQLFNPPQANGFLAVRLLSKRVADYSADPRSLNFPLKEASFLNDILRDKDPYATDLPGRLATLQTVLEEPIPTATPVSPGSPTPSAGPTATSRPGSTSSPRPTLSPSATVTPTGSLTSTPTLTATPTLTGSPTPTLTVTGEVTFTTTPTCGPTTSATNNCTPTPTVTLKASPSPTRTPDPAVTVPVKPTLTPTSTTTKVVLPSNTPTATVTQAPVIVPTNTNTPAPTKTPTETPTARPVIFPTVSTCNAIPANSLAAAADSYVDRTQADKNFGQAPDLFIRPSAGVDKRALVRFDLGSIPPGSQVVAAILYVSNKKGDNYAVSVLRVTEPWDEMGVTWNNQPAADTGSAAGSFTLTSDKCTRAAFLSSALVQGWVNDPGSNYGVMLYPPSGAGDVNFSSREGSNPPQLFVVFQ